jgi:hypothetical protein
MDIFKKSRSSLLAAVMAAIILCLVVTPVSAGWAWFSVSSSPSGAWACLDGSSCDDTPITFAVEDSTYHTISVYKDGYRMWRDTVGAGSSGTTTYVSASLDPEPSAVGYLDITPFDADIYLDGTYYGNGRQTIALAPGTYTLVLKKAGYYDTTQQFTVSPGATTTLAPGMTPYPSTVSYGDIQVQSTPAGAAIFLNGNYQGTTYAGSPLGITQLTPGTYTVQLTMPDYQPSTQTAVVQAGVVTTVAATMVPNVVTTPDTTGQISVTSTPAGAAIYLDNTYMGITPAVLANIAAGGHTLMLRESGYQDWYSTVNVVGGSYTPVAGTLAPASGNTPATTRAGIPAVLALAGICGALLLIVRKNH